MEWPRHSSQLQTCSEVDTNFFRAKEGHTSDIPTLEALSSMFTTVTNKI